MKYQRKTKIIETPQYPCPHCGYMLNFKPMPYLSTRQEFCLNCGELLQVDIAPINLKRICEVENGRCKVD